MKSIRVLSRCTAAFAGTVLAGCAGYNTTVFMTKSNAGLDFDLQPTTLELTISRKESVVAPSFEDGKTPPVLASFGADAGSSNALTRFFFGVDQTFAGGDAAVTMAKLYDDRDTPPDNTASQQRFDSAIPLSAAPSANADGVSKFRKTLFALSTPGKVKPFVFGTDTMLGLKIGWTGTGAAYPQTVRAGFNRKETAVAPLALITSTKNGATTYQAKMPSFLATIDSNVKAGTDGSVSTLQYFATGVAADHLARRPTVRAAMLSRADPAQAETFQQMEEARTRVQAHNDQVEEIVQKTMSDDGKTTDTTKLGAITNGISGLDQTWVNQFGGQSPEKLRTALRGIDRNSVPALRANLTKLDTP